nr:MAG TPA: hypothetical protein [Caudoviricetes sp.]
MVNFLLSILYINDVRVALNCVQIGFCAMKNNFSVTSFFFAGKTVKKIIIVCIALFASISNRRLNQIDLVRVLLGSLVIVWQSLNNRFAQQRCVLNTITAVNAFKWFWHNLSATRSVDNVNITHQMPNLAVNAVDHRTTAASAIIVQYTVLGKAGKICHRVIDFACQLVPGVNKSKKHVLRADVVINTFGFIRKVFDTFSLRHVFFILHKYSPRIHNVHISVKRPVQLFGLSLCQFIGNRNCIRSNRKLLLQNKRWRLLPHIVNSQKCHL